MKAEEKMKAGMKRADGATAGGVAGTSAGATTVPSARATTGPSAGATVGGAAGTTTRAAAAVAATEKGNKSREREKALASDKAKTSTVFGKRTTEKGKKGAD